MKTQNKKRQVYRSIGEFRNKFFPQLIQEQTIENHTEARDLGVTMAIESMKKVKKIKIIS